jgi:hypothetical protein
MLIPNVRIIRSLYYSTEFTIFQPHALEVIVAVVQIINVT